MIHSGTLSYLNKVHREKYGVHKYWMHTIRQWADGKYTVQFILKKEHQNETEENTA